jgi:hypothetical protein
VEGDPAAERLDAVLEADQAAAAGEIGAPAAVIANRDAQDAGDGLDFDGGLGAFPCLAAFVSASDTT